jgi:hypothetical protein
LAGGQHTEAGETRKLANREEESSAILATSGSPARDAGRLVHSPTPLRSTDARRRSAPSPHDSPSDIRLNPRVDAPGRRLGQSAQEVSGRRLGALEIWLRWRASGRRASVQRSLERGGGRRGARRLDPISTTNE